MASVESDTLGFSTIRHGYCVLILDEKASIRCEKCKTHQKLLNSMLNRSLVPRPRGRREKWPGIHCLRMRNDSGNLPRTSPIMDKLHVVVMRRNNQTRYMSCSVAAVFTRRWLPLSETQGVTRQGLRYNHRRFHRHCACSFFFFFFFFFYKNLYILHAQDTQIAVG